MVKAATHLVSDLGPHICSLTHPSVPGASTEGLALPAGGNNETPINRHPLGANHPFKELLQVISAKPSGANQQMRRKFLPFAL